MLSLPLPIVVALMLLTVLLLIRERLLRAPSGALFISLLGLYALSLVLVGLRWGYSLTLVLPLMALMATIWNTLAWLAFRSLSRPGPVIDWRADRIHALPAIAIIIGFAFWPPMIEATLVISAVIYAVLLGRLAAKGADQLRMVSLEQTRWTHLALIITTTFLLVSVLLEIVIAYDMSQGGKHAATIIAWVNVPSVFVLGLAAAIAGQSRPAAVPEEIADLPAEEDEAERRESAQLLEQLNALIEAQALHTEPDLTLQRLARKVGVPARRVSRAVNQITEQNVSQWINARRINAACELLDQSDQNVTEVMLAVGFATKSNFNREFRRITGSSPSAWRSRNLA